MRFILTSSLKALIIISILFASDFSRSRQNEFPVIQSNNERIPPSVKGRVIVKFQDSVTACVHCLLKRHARFAGATKDRSDSLDRLNSLFEVRSANPVFRSEDEERQMPGFASGASSDSLKAFHQRKLEAVKSMFPQRSQRIPKEAQLPDLHHIYVLEFSERFHPESVAAAFAVDPHVQYAHPDYLQQLDSVPNDTYYRSSGSWGQKYDDLWGLKKDKLDLEPAWDITKGEGIIVGVVDTGIDYGHPDISANIWKNRGEVAGNGRMTTATDM